MGSEPQSSSYPHFSPKKRRKLSELIGRTVECYGGQGSHSIGPGRRKFSIIWLWIMSLNLGRECYHVFASLSICLFLFHSLSRLNMSCDLLYMRQNFGRGAIYVVPDEQPIIVFPVDSINVKLLAVSLVIVLIKVSTRLSGK